MTVEAIEYRHELTSGSTRPLVLECESVEGERADYAVKLKTSSKTGVFGLAAEWICAGLAGNLNLVTPHAEVVHVGREFAESVPNPSIKARLLANLGANFGSKFLAGGYATGPKTNRSFGLFAGLRLTFYVSMFSSRILIEEPKNQTCCGRVKNS